MVATQSENICGKVKLQSSEVKKRVGKSGDDQNIGWRRESESWGEKTLCGTVGEHHECCKKT